MFLKRLATITKASALEGRSCKADGRRLSYLLPFKLVGFKAPAKATLGGLRLVVGLNPPLYRPSAFCPLPSAFVQAHINVYGQYHFDQKRLRKKHPLRALLHHSS